MLQQDPALLADALKEQIQAKSSHSIHREALAGFKTSTHSSCLAEQKALLGVCPRWKGWAPICPFCSTSSFHVGMKLKDQSFFAHDLIQLSYSLFSERFEKS
jgi:hypothetical protein